MSTLARQPYTVRDQRFFNKREIQLRERLQALMDRHHVRVMKLSTEDAGMPFSDIRKRHRLFGDMLPIQLKIGGPEARNDIRNAVRIGCQALIAPMIESPYALENFVRAVRDTLERKHFDLIDLQINVETVQAAQNIEPILNCKAASHLEQITVGRHDLSRSMGKEPNDPEVLETARNVVKAAHERDISTSLGGRITPGDAEQIAHRVQPRKLNTREIGIELKSSQQAERVVREVLDFEVELMMYEQSHYRTQDERLDDRIRKLESRKNM